MMEDVMNRTSWSSMITGITIGLGIGAALGILFAPQSGEDTRDYLMGAAKDRINDTKDRFSDVGDRIRDVRDRVSNVVESGKDFARQAQESMENVRGHIQDIADAGQRAYREAKNS
jgi:gas vesicle protein